MRQQLLDEIRRHRGVISRAQALAVASSYALTKAIATGVLVRVFPRVYATAETAADREVRRRAALLSIPGSALSHTDALAVWGGLPAERKPTGPIHLTVATGRAGRRPGGELVVHRRDPRVLDAALYVRGIGLTVSLSQALVDSWQLLAPDRRRAVIIDAVRDRRVSIGWLRTDLDRNPKAAGAAELRRLLDMLDAGCRSELEIWGLTHVFDHPDLPASVAQHRLVLPSGTVYLDRAYLDARVAVELDGAAYHFAPEQRERDMHRDAELAAHGWLVLRFSWRRLHDDPAGVRRQVRQALDARADAAAVTPTNTGRTGTCDAAQPP